MREELIPGVLHWTAPHPNIKMDVSSYFVTGSATLIDPLNPGGEDLEPERIVLTTRSTTCCSRTGPRSSAAARRPYEASSRDSHPRRARRAAAAARALAPPR